MIASDKIGIFRKELDDAARELATELLHDFNCHKDRDDLDDKFRLDGAIREIRNRLDSFEQWLVEIERKSTPNSPGSSFTAARRAQFRVEHIRTRTGYGSGCDLCWGGYDTETFMSFTIGTYKGRLSLDVCLPCAKRIGQVIDARLEDRRCRQNRRKK